MKDDYIKSTKQGKLYRTTEDFFKLPEIKEQVNKLLNSKVVKQLEGRKIKYERKVE